MHKDQTAFLFVVTALLCGLGGAFFFPLSSLFIVEALNASPSMLSLYMAASVFSSVVISQLIAKFSDNGWDRKKILLISLACYLVTVISFIFIRNYWLAVAIASTFGAVSGAMFGQLFAMGREYGDRKLEDSTSFVSTMRAGIAIAWVFGPPLAFVLKAGFGFAGTFTMSALASAAVIGVVYLGIPSIEATKTDSDSLDSLDYSDPIQSHMKGGKEAKTYGLVTLYSLIVVLMFSANNLYIASIPLYLSKELMVDASWLGMLFGSAALFEIPIMLLAGRFAMRLSTARVLAIGLSSGCLFYSVVLHSTDFYTLIMAQMLNGVFIGTCASLGMVLMQDMMRDRLGTASTLFSNLLQISMLVASLALGVIAELYNYYSTLYACLGGVLAALLLQILFIKLSSINRARTLSITT